MHKQELGQRAKMWAENCVAIIKYQLAVFCCCFSPWSFLHNKLFSKNVSKNERSSGEANKCLDAKSVALPLNNPYSIDIRYKNPDIEQKTG